MKKQQNNSTRASALRITLSIALILISAILLASSFRSANWSPLAADVMEMPIPIADQAIATLGNNIYSFSGTTEGALTGASYQFDGAAWKPIASYPLPAESSAAVSDGHRYIYIMNGVSSGSTYQTAMYRYDAVSNSYTQMAPNSVGARNQVVLYLNGRIYKMGGKNATGYQTALEIYDIATNSWSLGAPLPAAIPFGTFWVKNNFIYTPSYRYNIATNTWSKDVPTSIWMTGDVFAGVGIGQYNVYDNAGNFKETIGSGASTNTTGCSFNPALLELYTTHFQTNQVIVFDDAHPHNVLQTIGTGPGPTANESIVFDSAGNFYVGHADGLRQIEKYDSAGNLLATYSPTVGPRGTDWIDLAADQQTIFYTSEGGIVRRFDVSTNTQLADFASPGGTMYALRILPPGNGSGGLLVAHTSDILRLDGSGNVVQTYSVAGESGIWFALNLDPNGTSFWSGLATGTNHFYRFNIASGAVEVGPISSNPPSGTLAGLCLKGENTAAVSPTPSPTATAAATATATPTPTATALCQFPTSIKSNFNNFAINAGNYIWFTSVLKASSLGSNPVTIHFTGQTITSANFGPLSVPDATVTFDPNVNFATTTFGPGGVSMTTVPSNPTLAGNTFFSALDYQVPANLPGGIKNVTWSGTISTDTPGVKVNWQWAAAVYPNAHFSADYNLLGVKPVDDNKKNPYLNADHAGTPENFKTFVMPGATGGGGSNYTGGLSGTASVGPCQP
jgi:Kelch motif